MKDVVHITNSVLEGSEKELGLSSDPRSAWPSYQIRQNTSQLLTLHQSPASKSKLKAACDDNLTIAIDGLSREWVSID
jgi:hypothetical protein